MSKSGQKKKHVCAECGESFGHGIRLRKHQRQTGHKGSVVEEEGGGDEEGAAEAAPPAQASPPPPAAPAESPLVEESSQEIVAASSPLEEDEPPVYSPDDETVAVNLNPTPIANAVAPGRAPSGPAYESGPSKLDETRAKLNQVGTVAKEVISARAKDASKQIKQSARSGADIFTEAFKIAVALLAILAVPTIAYFWWRHANPQRTEVTAQTTVVQRQEKALAARSALLEYFNYLGNGSMDEAYQFLDTSWQSDLSENSFRDAFLDIRSLRWAVNDQALLDDGRAEVLTRLAFQEGGKSKSFIGRFRLIQRADGWRIEGAELSPDDSP